MNRGKDDKLRLQSRGGSRSKDFSNIDKSVLTTREGSCQNTNSTLSNASSQNGVFVQSLNVAGVVMTDKMPIQRSDTGSAKAEKTFLFPECTRLRELIVSLNDSHDKIVSHMIELRTSQRSVEEKIEEKCKLCRKMRIIISTGRERSQEKVVRSNLHLKIDEEMALIKELEKEKETIFAEMSRCRMLKIAQSSDITQNKKKLAVKEI